MRNDLLGGLKNALARGSTTEEAIRSFVNAGYNEYEVREAAKSITQGSLETVYPQKETATLPSPTQVPPQIHSDKKLTRKIVILATVLLLLICALMFVLLVL